MDALVMRELRFELRRRGEDVRCLVARIGVAGSAGHCERGLRGFVCGWEGLLGWVGVEGRW